MTGAQKRTLAGLVAVVILLIILVGGYMFILKRYPLEYESEIYANARDNDLDASFIAAVICTESRFNKEAESHAGAIGLMQIMPETGEWIAGKIGMDDFTAEMLKDPEVNMRLGCWYLNYLMDKFDGNVVNVAAAYNAGHNKVAEWLKDPSYSENGQLTNIPYEETANYVKRIERAQKIYEILYDM